MRCGHDAVRFKRDTWGRHDSRPSSRLRLELAAEHSSLHEAEDALTEARCALDVARLEWELARYKAKAIELSLLGVAA